MGTLCPTTVEGELPPTMNKLKCEQNQGFRLLGRSSLNLRRQVNYHLESISLFIDFNIMEAVV